MRKNNRLKEIEKYVSQEFSKHNLHWFDEYHVKLMWKLALKLNEIKKGNEEVIKLAVLLHDAARMKDPEHHDTIGAKESKKFLKKYGYSESIIKQVSHCIETHRCINKKPKTLEAKIISSADAMAHLKFLPILFWVPFRIKKMDIEDGIRWIRKKIDRDWKQKILLPEAKEMIKKEYQIASKILDQLQKIKE